MGAGRLTVVTWPPRTRYAKRNGVHVAFQVSGEGAIDALVLFGHMIGLEEQTDGVHCSRFVRRMGAFSRVIRLDRRGTGRSDPLTSFGAGRLDEWVDDMLSVLDTVGVERAAVIGLDPAGGYGALLLAATHPERVSHLILGHAAARPVASDDGYPWGLAADTDLEERTQRWLDAMLDDDHSEYLDRVAPSLVDDDQFREWWATAQRRFAAPSVRWALYRAWLDLDLRAALPAIDVPTLVMLRPAFRGAGHSRYLAEHIRDAQSAELGGRDGLLYIGDIDSVIGEIEEFVTGTRARTSAGGRRLLTVLFTDIVESTARGASIGDQAWSQRLDAHDAMVRRQLALHRGTEVNTTGDGFVATFDGPGRAIDAALGIRDGARQIGVEVRAALHIGEVEPRSDDITGMTVNIAARVLERAATGEVLVSRTVADLVAGGGFALHDRGDHVLKGVPGSWTLLAVSR